MKKAKEKNRMSEMWEWEEKNENEGMTTKRENKLLEESRRWFTDRNGKSLKTYENKKRWRERKKNKQNF